MKGLLKLFKRPKENDFYCKYNENATCYETPCNFCTLRNECQWCCGGECWSCEGLMLKKRGLKNERKADK